MILEILIIAAAIPTGLLISYLSRDELIQGRKWFVFLLFLGVILGVAFYMGGKKVESLTLLFIAITSLTSYVKSKDSKWTRKI